MRAGLVLAIGPTLWLLGAAAGAAAAEELVNSCVSCHESKSQEELSAPVAEWRDSVHGEAQVSCDACHGGDPFSEDQEAAHDEDEAAFLGAPSWWDVPEFCGACHEDILDGYTQSVMAGMIDEGEKVAVCTTCHMTEGHSITHKPAREILTDERCGECHDAEVAAGLRDTIEATSGRILEVDSLLEAVHGAIDTARQDREMAEIRQRVRVIAHTYDLERIEEVADVSLERVNAVALQASNLSERVRLRRQLGGGVVVFFLVAFVGTLRLERDLSRRDDR